jgi:hypothetical protein
MTYAEALKEAARVGANRATGEPALAQACKALSLVHAINPKKVFEGAVKSGLSGRDVVALAHRDPAALGALSQS